jgi:hypothetical protein
MSGDWETGGGDWWKCGGCERKKERMVVSAGWPWGEARSGLSK